MDRDRLTAFTDGVVAVIITIMVLDLKPPATSNLNALIALWPLFLSYIMSFVYVAIYWNNHHHFFHLVERVNGSILWANMNLLFWVSLIPFATAWLGTHSASAWPTAIYLVALLMCALAWTIMQAAIIRHQGPNSLLKRALGSDLKGNIATLIYAAGIALAFITPAIADLLYLTVAGIWVIPDRRVENVISKARLKGAKVEP